MILDDLKQFWTLVSSHRRKRRPSTKFALEHLSSKPTLAGRCALRYLQSLPSVETGVK
jgi:hypothetical protein